MNYHRYQHSNEEMIGLANEMNQMSFHHIRASRRRGNRNRNGRNRSKRGPGRGGMRNGRGNGRNRVWEEHQQNLGEVGAYHNHQQYGVRQAQPMFVHGVPNNHMYSNSPNHVVHMNMNNNAQLGPLRMHSNSYQNGYENQYHIEDEPKSIEELKGHMYAMSRTQSGCRTIQRLLAKDDQAYRAVFEELQDHIATLISDPFGHHLCMKLIDFIEEAKMREIVLAQLKDDLVAVSLSVHGTRVIQKLLEVMQTPLELEMVQNAIQQYVITLAKDVYGMHVILRCLHRIPPPNENSSGPSNQFIFDKITKNIVSVATHKHGCCVVQWCIDYATSKQRRKLVDVVVANALELSQDAFGNYVVQQIMDPTHPEVLEKLVSHLAGSVNKLAVQKFSSIVIEKCLEYTESSQQMQIINELINPVKLPRLLQDPYANYVIQKALSVTKQENFQKVVEAVRPHLETLSVTTFGKRIKTQMIRRFPILSMGPKNSHNSEAIHTHI